MEAPALEAFEPGLLAAGAELSSDTGLPTGTERIGEGVFHLPLLRPSWCLKLRSELTRYAELMTSHGHEPEPPNSMHAYGFDVAPVGLRPFLDGLLSGWIRPLAQRAFPAVPRLEELNAFVVDYGAGGDHGLGFHVDDSDVTVTLCLEEAGGGSELYFEGVRCGLHVDGPAHPHERLVVSPRLGWAVVHLGKNRHGVRPITRGRRRNLVIWCRSVGSQERWVQDYQAGRCPPWCGEQASQG